MVSPDYVAGGGLIFMGYVLSVNEFYGVRPVCQRVLVVPADKKSGASDFGFAVARFGTPTNELHGYLGMKGWGDLDGPIGAQKGMTADEYKAFLAKLQPMIESTEWSIWKFEPELSYLAESK